MEEKKKKFFKRIVDNPQWLMYFVLVISFTFYFYVILFDSNEIQEPGILHQDKNYKSVYLGKMGISHLRIWKLTIDSTEYIVVGNGGAVSIIKHSK